MEVREIPIESLDVSAFNTRKDLHAGTEDSSLNDLAQSIREHGLLSPVTVRPVADGRYELLAGQRRFLACSSLGWTSIPALVSQIDDEKAVTVSLIENVHRADLHPMDKAQAFQQLTEYYEGDIVRVSKQSGVGTATIRKYLSMLRLPESIRRELSTREGPAKIETLHQLTRTFESPTEIQFAYNQIQGFGQDIQVQIIRQSEGQIGNIPRLVMQAQEGAFSTRFCHGLAGKLMCEFIPEELAEQVIQLVTDHRAVVAGTTDQSNTTVSSDQPGEAMTNEGLVRTSDEQDKKELEDWVRKLRELAEESDEDGQ